CSVPDRPERSEPSRHGGHSEAVHVGLARVPLRVRVTRGRLCRRFVYAVARSGENADACSDHEVPRPVVSLIDQRDSATDQRARDAAAERPLGTGVTPPTSSSDRTVVRGGGTLLESLGFTFTVVVAGGGAGCCCS